MIKTLKSLSKKTSPLNNQDGSAIVIALIILVSLTVIGIGVSNISIEDQFIAGNDVVKKISFFNSDAGVFAVPKVISRSVNDRATPANMTPPFVFTDVGVDTTTTDRTFYRELSGLSDYDTDGDISFQNDGTNNTTVDIQRLGSFSLVGGGAEFASGAEGHGTSLKGIRYMMTSTGTAPKNAVTIIQARYLKVLGTAGGL